MKELAVVQPKFADGDELPDESMDLTWDPQFDIEN